MRPGLAALLAAVLLAVPTVGCLDDPGEPSNGMPEPTILGTPTGETRASDELWIVWVEGEENLTPDPGYVCDVAFDHTVREGEQEILYENHSYDFDPREVTYLLAFDLWEGTSSCPIVYRLHTDGSELTETLGSLGNLTLAPGEDGSLLLDGQTRLQPGQTARYMYEATGERGGEQVHIEGSLEVKLLGAWPRSGLRPA